MEEWVVGTVELMPTFLLSGLTRCRKSLGKGLTLVESTGYGGGMKVAMRDLEIRGAGNIL